MKVLEKLSYVHSITGKPVEVNLEVGRYSNGRIALELTQVVVEEGSAWRERFLVASCNLPEYDLPENVVFIKEWEENEGMTDWLIRNRVIEAQAHCMVQSGHVQVSAYRLTPAFMLQIGDALALGGRDWL